MTKKNTSVKSRSKIKSKNPKRRHVTFTNLGGNDKYYEPSKYPF